MKRIVWTTLFIFMWACAAMAAPEKEFLTYDDAGSIITLDQSTVAVIELQSNPSTGYGWRAKQPLGKHIRIVGSEFESSQPGMKGAWGKEKIYVVGASKGETSMVMEYRRAFGNEVDDTVQFNFYTVEKFTETFTVPKPEVPVEASEPQAGAAVDLALPTAFNWCQQGGCTPVKDQGNCGSCWAFATVTPLESLILIKDGVTKDLSEQYLVSCNSDGWGCNGGFWAHDYHEWKKVSGEYEAGAVLESVFPYQAADVACNPPHDKAYKITSWEYVCGSSNCTPTTDQIKQAIYDHGPLTVAVCVNSSFQNYTGGVFTGPSCSSLNHGVVLVGWDDADNCWIMRNSWGSNWGESGYMRIRYGVSGIGSEACYVEYGGSPGPGPDPGEITNGQTISNLAASQGEWLHYFIDVPQGATNLRVEISGGSGDADLYTRFGAQPTTSGYDCRPYLDGNSESCTSATLQAGRWYIGLRGYRSFSGVSLTASYDDSPGPGPGEGEIINGQTISNLAASQGEWLHYFIDVPQGARNLRVQIFGGSGDADLYARIGARPTTSEYDCRPYLDGNNETCNSSTPQAGRHYIGLRGYRNFSGVSLTASYD